jgi:thiol-disulfide isomerase/thioredoxin
MGLAAARQVLALVRGRAESGDKVSGRVARYERSRTLRRVGAAAVVVSLIAVFAVATWLVPPAPAVPPGTADCTSDRAGQNACDFTVSLVNRPATFSLAGGQGPFLVEFMGSHCSTCQAQMESLTKVVSKYRAQGLTAVSLDVGGVLGTEDPQDAVAFMADNGGDWDIALDNDAIAIDYGVITLPTIFLIDESGKVAFRTGYISQADLSAQVEALL